MGSEVFTITGFDTFTVPNGVAEITVKCWGAGGGGGGADSTTGGGAGGGGGGFARGTIEVDQGDVFDVHVGGGGGGGTGGQNGSGGGGGGASFVRFGGSFIMTAGGGGGGGGGDANNHGAGYGGGGGASTGATGGDDEGQHGTPVTTGGGGGTQSAGGAGGNSGSISGTAGGSLFGGEGGNGTWFQTGGEDNGGVTNGGDAGIRGTNLGAGGGGGSGYYGGGGGGAATSADAGGGGGGGGSNYISGTSTTNSQGNNGAGGYAGGSTSAGGTGAGQGDSDYQSGTGDGGSGGTDGSGNNGSDAEDGAIVITWADGPGISSVGDGRFTPSETNVTISGADFGASETGSAQVELGNAWKYSDCTVKVTQSIDSWSSTSIQFDISLGALSPGGRVWVFVTDSAGATNGWGYPVLIGNFQISTYSTIGSGIHYINSRVLNSKIYVKMWSGGGGGGGGGTYTSGAAGGAGGGGGYLECDINVSQGDLLDYIVAGYGGGGGILGTGSGDGGGGGGASSISSRNPTQLECRCGAGGGGGGGDNTNATNGGAGGGGGSATGGSGGDGASTSNGGVGGNLVSGGDGGVVSGSYSDGGDGSSNQGGDGGDGNLGETEGGAENGDDTGNGGDGGMVIRVNCAAGGGGAGGYYGGGGGGGGADQSGSGGGGGSSWVYSTNTKRIWSKKASGSTAANTGDVDYPASTGDGGSGGVGGASRTAGSNGERGAIVVLWIEPDGNFNQDSFRMRNDDGSETLATWKAPINTNLIQGVDQNFRLRFLIKEEDDTAVNDVSFQLQYRLNNGGWNDVNGSSSVVRSFASSNFVDGADTTQQIGSGTYITNNDCMDEVDGSAGGSNLDFTTTANQEVEVEFCIQIRSADVSDDDEINFRLLLYGEATLNKYTITPSLIARIQVWEVYLSSYFANKDSTTRQLSVKSGTFVSGQMLESTVEADSNNLSGDGYTEYEYCIQATSDAESSEQYEFRLVDEDQSGEQLEEYNVTPKVTLSA